MKMLFGHRPAYMLNVQCHSIAPKHSSVDSLGTLEADCHGSAHLSEQIAWACGCPATTASALSPHSLGEEGSPWLPSLTVIIKCNKGPSSGIETSRALTALLINTLIWRLSHCSSEPVTFTSHYIFIQLMLLSKATS